MVNLSIREAVKHFQVSRPTLTKALKSGKISGIQDGNGYWILDPSELARIYNPRSSEVVKVDKRLPGELATGNTPLSGQIEVLKERLVETERRAAVAEALAEERGKHIEDLRRMLPGPEVGAAPRRWWQLYKISRTK